MNAPASALKAGTRAGAAASAFRPIRALFNAFLARRGLVAVCDQAIVSAANFSTSLLLGRLCPESDLGIYFLALSFLYFLRGIQEQLITGPYTIYSQRRDGTALSSYTGSLFVHQAVLLVISLGLLTLLSLGLMSGFGPRSFLDAAPLLFVAAPLMLFRDFLRQISFARLNVAQALGIDVVASVIQITTLLVFAATGRLNVTTAYVSISFASAAAAVVWFLGRCDSISFQPQHFRADFRTNWIFGRWALASQLIGCSLPYLLPWIVASSDGAEAAGLLGATGTLVGIGNLFVTGVCNYLSPRAAKAWVDGGKRELTAVLSKTAALFLIVVGTCCIVAWLQGDLVLRLVYGRTFDAGGSILLLLSLNMLANSLGMTFGNGLWAIEKPAANFRADVAAFCVTAAGSLWLIPAYSAWGSAAAMCCGTTCGAWVRGMTLFLELRREACGAQPRGE